jgi:hypothetical protein
MINPRFEVYEVVDDVTGRAVKVFTSTPFPSDKELDILEVVGLRQDHEDLKVRVNLVEPLNTQGGATILTKTTAFQQISVFNLELHSTIHLDDDQASTGRNVSRPYTNNGTLLTFTGIPHGRYTTRI